MEKENKNVFDKVEKQLDLNGNDATNKLAELRQQRQEILEEGGLNDLKEIDAKIAEVEDEEDELKAPNIDDLDDVAPSQKYKMYDFEKGWEDGTVLTIERVRLQPVRTKDRDENIIEPETSANGKYYKSKIVLEFEEEVNGSKIKQTIPSIYYGVSETGEINNVPGIPQACEDEELNDRLVSSMSKLRNKYAKFVGKDKKDISNKEFIKGLVGKKVKLSKESGKHDGRKWAKLVVTDFVK